MRECLVRLDLKEKVLSQAEQAKRLVLLEWRVDVCSFKAYFVLNSLSQLRQL